METRPQLIDFDEKMTCEDEIYSQVLIGPGDDGEIADESFWDDQPVPRIIAQCQSIIKITLHHHNNLKEHPAYQELITRFISNEFSFYTNKKPINEQDLLTIIKNIESSMVDLPPNIHLILATFAVKNKKGKTDNLALVVHSPRQKNDKVKFHIIKKCYKNEDDFDYKNLLENLNVNSSNFFIESDINQYECAIQITTAGNKRFIMVIEICLDHCYKRGLDNTRRLLKRLKSQRRPSPEKGIHFLTSRSTPVKHNNRVARVIHADPDHFDEKNNEICVCIDCNDREFQTSGTPAKPTIVKMDNFFGSFSEVRVYTPTPLRTLKFHNININVPKYTKEYEEKIWEKIKAGVQQKKYYLALKNVIKFLTLKLHTERDLHVINTKILLQVLALPITTLSLQEINSLKLQLKHLSNQTPSKTPASKTWLHKHKYNFIKHEDFILVFQCYLIEACNEKDRLEIFRYTSELFSYDLLKILLHTISHYSTEHHSSHRTHPIVPIQQWQKLKNKVLQGSSVVPLSLYQKNKASNKQQIKKPSTDAKDTQQSSPKPE